MKFCRIGVIGLDSPHVPAFAQLLHDATHEYHVPGGRITAAFAGGSPDFDLSISRVGKFTAEMRDLYEVEIVEAVSALRGKCDALILGSIDGRVHLDQFRQVAEWGLPVFLNKPLSASLADAREIVRLAAEKRVPILSASAIRYAESFQLALAMDAGESVTGAEFYGPMPFQEKCAGYFWYGIHSAEMLFASMGAGCCEVLATREEAHDIIVGRWRDGRLGVLRGNRIGNQHFGGVIHRGSKSVRFDVSEGVKSYYASLLEVIISFFHGNSVALSPEEMVAVIGFLEAANRSAATRTWVAP